MKSKEEKLEYAYRASVFINTNMILKYLDCQHIEFQFPDEDVHLVLLPPARKRDSKHKKQMISEIMNAAAIRDGFYAASKLIKYEWLREFMEKNS